MSHPLSSVSPIKMTRNPTGPYHNWKRESHKILWLTSSVTCLFTVCNVAELTVLEDTLHLDDTTPLAEKNLRTFTMSVL